MFSVLSHIGIFKQVWNQNTDDACALDEGLEADITIPTGNTMKSVRWCGFYTTGCIKKNGAHLLCQIISKLLKLIAQFWTCFKPRSFLFRTSRNSYFYSQ